VPTEGAAGIALTVSEYSAVAALQGTPSGLLVVTVIVTILPASPAAGVYWKEKGDTLVEEVNKVPEPLPVIITLVALPPKVLPLTVTAAVPHVLPLVLFRVKVGGFAHPQETEKGAPVVVHFDAFITVMV
jgi:hypothetical protein